MIKYTGILVFMSTIINYIHNFDVNVLIFDRDWEELGVLWNKNDTTFSVWSKLLYTWRIALAGLSVKYATQFCLLILFSL